MSVVHDAPSPRATTAAKVPRDGDVPLQAAALLRLLQLSSPTLPVGAYSYSQGLEAAVEQGTVHDKHSAAEWIADHLELVVGRLEAPVWWRLQGAWARGEGADVAYWNGYFLATRETAESRLETVQMGGALRRLLVALPAAENEFLVPLQELAEVSLPCAFTAAVHLWRIPAPQGLLGYLWSWLENQVLAAMKTVPLGQVAGQTLLQELAARIPAVVAHAMDCGDDDLGNFAPGLAIAGSRHETQYSRLFRS